MRRCSQQKSGKFDRLHCCLEAGHEGPCNFVVVGVRPAATKPGRQRTRSDDVYLKEKGRRKPS
jgi:hypothetical protein